MKKQLTEWKVLELFVVNTWMNQNCSLWIEQSTMTVWALLFEGQSKDGGNFTFETCLTCTRHLQTAIKIHPTPHQEGVTTLWNLLRGQ